ncbi:MAG: hypothetical protein HHJ09_02350 [Glaciimonas sp.]|nr:hypothetical protein [Glaciimonas sp.]
MRADSLYSDLAIETGLMLRLAVHLPLRQTEGLMTSVFELMGVSLCIPDHSTLSRRAMTINSISRGCHLPDGPAHLLIDSRRFQMRQATSLACDDEMRCVSAIFIFLRMGKNSQIGS